MSMRFFCLGIMLLVTTPPAAALSTCVGIGCCGHPISIKVWLNYTHLRAAINKDTHSASAADDIKNLIICDVVSTAPLKAGIGTFSERHA